MGGSQEDVVKEFVREVRQQRRESCSRLIDRLRLASEHRRQSPANIQSENDVNHQVSIESSEILQTHRHEC
jgi:hypothetical protein